MLGGYGWVMRDVAGLLKMAGGMGGEVFHGAAMAEAGDIRAALVKCKDLGSDKVEVESDALSIIQMLNGEFY